jgi:Bacterial Ig domain
MKLLPHRCWFSTALFPVLLVWFEFSGCAGTLTGTFSPIATGSNVDLTAVGKLDWVHWGLYTADSLDRKASVTPQIGNFSLVGNPIDYQENYQYADNANGYTWHDGTPVASVTNTTTGVWAYQYNAGGLSEPLGSGFQVTVPAGTNVETLEVFVGAYNAVGRFTAALSDGSAMAFTNKPNATVNNIGNGPGGVFAITFAANSSNQTLTVQWKVATQYGSDANVTLQAAALTTVGADNPPYAVITNPAPNTAFPESNSIVIEADAQDFDGTVTNVAFFAGTNQLGQTATSPYSFTWSNPPRGRYFLTAEATDNGGATGISQPVEVFVYGVGGSQSNSVASPPAAVDLTSEGTADWTHWGLVTNTSFDHKNLVPRQISNFTALGTKPVQQYSDNYTAFSWSDGAPTPSASSTTTGVFVTGETNGFLLTAPADPHPRQLRVYVGGYGVQGEFQAWLSDFSAPPFVDTSSVSNVYGNSYVVYSINYTAATTNQQLVFVYRPLQLFDQVYGNVTLQAATLQSEAPLPVAIQNPQWLGNGLAFSFLTQTNQTYTILYTYSLSPASWQPLTSFSGNGTIMNVTNQSAVVSNCFYRVETQ